MVGGAQKSLGDENHVRIISGVSRAISMVPEVTEVSIRRTVTLENDFVSTRYQNLVVLRSCNFFFYV